MTSDRFAVIAATGAPADTPAARSAEADEPVRPGDPVCEVREFLFEAWTDLLGCTNLTEHSDFFARGGDSLLITRLARRVGKRFGVVVTMHDMSRRNLGDQIVLVRTRLSRGPAHRARPVVTTRSIRTFVARQWAELLGCRVPFDHSDFFALGGDSLLGTRLVRRLEKEFGIDVPVRDILGATTLAGQVLLLGGLLAESPRPAHTPRNRAA
ncbi:acyl carrier protein [Streptomyces sp. TE33382]